MKDKRGIERPWLCRAIRAGEILGLLMTMYGLASSQWPIAAAGAGLIIGSYQIYRRWFPIVSSADNGSTGMSDGGD